MQKSGGGNLGRSPKSLWEMYCRSAKQCQRLHEEVIPSGSSAGGAVVEGESKSGRVSCLISCERGDWASPPFQAN